MKKSLSIILLLLSLFFLFLLIFLDIDPLSYVKNQYLGKDGKEEATGCVKEGKIGSYFERDECCNGLAAVVAVSSVVDKSASSYEKRCAISGGGGHFLCTKCGNNICERIETECNCPEDCSGILFEFILDRINIIMN